MGITAERVNAKWVPDSALEGFVGKRFELRLGNYERIPDEVRDHHESEIEALAGGYSYRQIWELIQNAADAILEDASQSSDTAMPASGQIVLSLADRKLYSANTGAPLGADGIIALLSARSSSKRGNQIGRFGIGFKSLLGLGGRIDLLSRSVSIRFDPEECGATIRRRLRLAPDCPTPGLRLAWPLDASAEFALDPTLNELSDWATTVVRADIGNDRMVRHLANELASFPGEFLLFLPTDINLQLEGGPDSLARKLRRDRTEDQVLLIENGQESPWLVVESQIPITDPEAQADATTVHNRREVPIAWALPLNSGEERAGRFWAFFPTASATRIPGILNAPWKVNSDRSAIIPGPYNSFLMRAASEMVVSAISKLPTKEDPSRPLDMFPRELESRDEPARPLVEAIWDRLAAARLVPDGSGTGRVPGETHLHPIDDEIAVRLWWAIASPEQRTQYLHPSCYHGQHRLNRLKFLLRRSKIEPIAPLVSEWIELAASTDPIKALQVLKLVKQIAESESKPEIRTQLRNAVIIPAADGTLVAAVNSVFATGEIPPGKAAVHGKLADNPKAYRILSEVLGIRPLDHDQWRDLLGRAHRDAQNAQSHWDLSKRDAAWIVFWSTIRSAPSAVAREFLSTSGVIRVRTKSGAWAHPSNALLVGTLIATDEQNEACKVVLVDMVHHHSDEKFLQALGIGAEPSDGWTSWTNELGVAYQNYRNEARNLYSSVLAGKNQSPQWAYLDCIDNDNVVLAGASLLPLLPNRSLAGLSRLLLDRLHVPQLRHVRFGHTTRANYYEPIVAPAPTSWLLATYGVVEIDSHSVKLSDLIAARGFAWIRQLPAWTSTMQRVDVLVTGFPPGWQPPCADLKSLWGAALVACEQASIADDIRRACYEAAAEHGYVPAQVRVNDRQLPLVECYVTSSDVLAGLARQSGIPVLVLAASAVRLWTNTGAQDLSVVARIKYDGPAGEPLSLLDVVPEIATAIKEASRTIAWVRSCQRLRMQVGDAETFLPTAYYEDELLVDLENLQRMPWRDRLTTLVREAANAGWLAGDHDQIAEQIINRNYIQRRADVAQKPTVPQRLLAAVGGGHEALLESFDDAVQKAINLKQISKPLDLARLALAVHGPTVLSVLSERLEKEGLRPPSRWGTQEAYDFVASLGFPPEFGGSRSARRSSELWTTGPMPLGKLHDYQERLVGELRALIAAHGATPARAVLSLPTGSGKTRVAIETAISAVFSPALGPVLWIAQTDELCEQAVQSFRQVWANIGEPWTDLRILRLWGGNPNPGASDNEVPTVVVASIQTIVSRIAGGLPDWIRNAGLVVIDEAHHAIAPSYTRLLDWLTGKTEEHGKQNLPPLVGLSATPFRGRDEEESRRLARRFNGRLLPAPEQQTQLYEELQERGILSKILVEPLNYEVPFALTDEEKQQVNIFDEFPESAAKRLSEDDKRNQRIVDSVALYAEKGQVLLFANSVWHASHLSALFELRGVPAATVHGGTEAAARQYFIRRFQNRDITVLCNYAVLTSGFDAPRTDVIVISRPIFSPVRYMQMVGRGLRGEKNGGTKECHVVTVLDNIIEYSDRLAYHRYFIKHFAQ